jgi:hypothetical protein
MYLDCVGAPLVPHPEAVRRMVSVVCELDCFRRVAVFPSAERHDVASNSELRSIGRLNSDMRDANRVVLVLTWLSLLTDEGRTLSRLTMYEFDEFWRFIVVTVLLQTILEITALLDHFSVLLLVVLGGLKSPCVVKPDAR